MGRRSGSPEEDLEVPPRQAPRPARDLGAARRDVRAVRLAEAVASRLPDVQDVPRARGQASPGTRSLATVPIRVAIDALGGDHAPGEVVAGAVEAASDAIEPVLFGPAGLDAQGLGLVPCEQAIAMDEKPAEAVRAKPDSSLVRSARAVATATLRRSSRRGTRGRCSPPRSSTCAGSPASCAPGSRS